MKNIGKRNVLALMPISRSELLGYCSNGRQTRKLDAAISTLKKKGLVEENRHQINETVDGKLVVTTTIDYALATKAEAA